MMDLSSVVRTSLGGGHQRRLTVSLCAGAVVLLAFVVSMASPAVAASSFPDVSASHPYFTAIEGMATRGIIEGYTDGTFGPSDLVIRQQFAKMIVLTMGYEPTESDWCPFPDVEHLPGDLYPFHFVARAASAGLTTGYTNGTFGPGNPITRQQVITMVVRAGGSKLETPPLGGGASSILETPHTARTSGWPSSTASLRGWRDRRRIGTLPSTPHGVSAPRCCGT